MYYTYMEEDGLRASEEEDEEKHAEEKEERDLLRRCPFSLVRQGANREILSLTFILRYYHKNLQLCLYTYV